MVQHLSAQEIIQYISDAKKSTPLKVYVTGHFENVTFPESFKVFGSEHSKVILWSRWMETILSTKSFINHWIRNWDGSS